jgi:hypothetical protein
VKIFIEPEPTEPERRAILAALEAFEAGPEPQASHWRASALADLVPHPAMNWATLLEGALGNDPLAEESWSDPGVVEP